MVLSLNVGNLSEKAHIRVATWWRHWAGWNTNGETWGQSGYDVTEQVETRMIPWGHPLHPVRLWRHWACLNLNDDSGSRVIKGLLSAFFIQNLRSGIGALKAGKYKFRGWTTAKSPFIGITEVHHKELIADQVPVYRDYQQPAGRYKFGGKTTAKSPFIGITGFHHNIFFFSIL